MAAAKDATSTGCKWPFNRPAIAMVRSATMALATLWALLAMASIAWAPSLHRKPAIA
jgi:hypothetical protein